jgi:hypothetical protein
MIPLDDSFEHLIDPANFVKNFADKEHFKAWADQRLINDIKETIKCFEKREMHLHCAWLQEVIDERIDKMLSDFGFN